MASQKTVRVSWHDMSAEESPAAMADYFSGTTPETTFAIRVNADAMRLAHVSRDVLIVLLRGNDPCLEVTAIIPNAKKHVAAENLGKLHTAIDSIRESYPTIAG
jgi:hypothetical protein